MGIDLFPEPILRNRLKTKVDLSFVRIVRVIRCRRDRCDKLGAIVQHWPANIDMVEQHMRRTIKTLVLDPVVNRDAGFADPGLDPPNEMQVLREHRDLGDLSFGPECAVVAVPARAVTGQARRFETDAAVNTVPDAVTIRIVVVLRTLLGHAENMIQTTCVHEA